MSTEAQKLNYFKLGLNLCGISLTKEHTELLYKVITTINELGGDFSIRDFALIQAELDEKNKRHDRKAKKAN